MFDKSNKTHPPATRFNAGQKLIFWAVVVGGAALSVSGILLLFPFSLADINGMQIAQYFHATAGLAMIAVILAHIYIGTLGMEGRSEEHTSELQALMRISYAVFCFKKKTKKKQ